MYEEQILRVISEVRSNAVYVGRSGSVCGDAIKVKKNMR